MDRPADHGGRRVTRAALYTKHRPLARYIAQDYFLPGSERQDVEQECDIGLWIATGDWDPEGGASFKTFANLVIRRRLSSLVVAALRHKHEPLTRSLRTTTLEDGGDLEEVAIVDTLAGGRDPLELVVARETFDRLCEAASRLSAAEREALQLLVDGTPYPGDKRMDNAVQRTRRKLRAAA